MTQAKQKVILITGASSGIGKACFDFLSTQGHQVYGTSRKPSEQENMLQMDVTNQVSIQSGVDQIVKKHGRLDVLVNNAGISMIGAIEDTSEKEARQIFETNFWGVIKTNSIVLPIMHQQKSGLIINISSVLGLFSIPYQGLYTASKFALEGMTEALRMELKPFNIKVCLIEPGDFRTKIGKNRLIAQKALQNSPHKINFDIVRKGITEGERQGDDVMKIANLVMRIIKMKNPKLRYRVGKPLDLLATQLKKILPQKMFERLIMSHYDL